MYKSLFVGCALVLGLLAGPVEAASVRVDFPTYDAVRHMETYGSRETYDSAVHDRRFVMEKAAYSSDGLTVYAYIYRPVAAPRKRMPVIIFNRGSWTWPSFAAEMLPMAHRMAERGYLVVAPMYRGSGGAQGVDELGGADLADLFNLIPVIKGSPYADSERLYLYGESRGGMMVYQALRDGFPAKAAAVYGAFTDLDMMLAKESGANTGAQIWGDALKKDRETIVLRRSALRWPEKISAPVLIMQGGSDRGVDPAHSLKLAERLQELEKPYELRIFYREGHTITGRAEERDRAADEWFTRFAAIE